MSVMRAFIAIKISADISKKLRDIQAKLKQAQAHVSWVNPENIHLTLQFLGNIDEDQVPAIIAQIEEAVKVVAPFQLQIGYAGAFPNLRYPRVIWIGVTDNEEQSLKTLQTEISSQMAQIGFEQEDGRFKPHLTLGRIRSQKNKSTLVRAIEGMVNIWVGGLSVDTVYLIRSDLKPTGAEYTDLGAVSIKQDFPLTP
jgi:RNA 2',3'-cyclic 3'-phosphodiesterase